MISPTVRVIRGLAGGGADLVEAARIEHAIDALADGEATAGVLTGDAVGAAHFLRQRDACAKFGEFRFPADRRGLVRGRR